MLPRVLRAALRVLVVPTVAVHGYYLLLFVAQRSLVFPAPTGPDSTPRPADIRELALRDERGRAVQAWYLPAATGRPAAVAVFLHGNAERAEEWFDQFRVLRTAGVGVLVPEYPGYGMAPGAPSEESLTSAALAAFDWIRNEPGLSTVHVVVYGRSLGGGVATRLAVRRPVAGLILESSFTDLRWFASRFYAPGFLVRDPFDNVATLRQFSGPLLVLHGERDEIAPYVGGQTLAGTVAGARFVSMPCGHNDCSRPWATILMFLRDRGLAPPAT